MGLVEEEKNPEKPHVLAPEMGQLIKRMTELGFKQLNFRISGKEKDIKIHVNLFSHKTR